MIRATVVDNYYETVPSGTPAGFQCDVCGEYSEQYMQVDSINKVYDKTQMTQVEKPMIMGNVCKTCLTEWIGEL